MHREILELKFYPASTFHLRRGFFGSCASAFSVPTFSGQAERAVRQRFDIEAKTSASLEAYRAPSIFWCRALLEPPVRDARHFASMCLLCAKIDDSLC
jgi:hypothetical protein